MDLLATIPFSEIIDSLNSDSDYTVIFKYLKIIRMLRVTKLFKLVSAVNSLTLQAFIILLKLLLGFLTIVIFFLEIIFQGPLDCLYLGFKSSTEHKTSVWLPSTLKSSNMGLEILHFYTESSNFDKYTWVLYSMVTLILGNDIQPVVIVQVIFSIIILIGGQFFLSIFFAQIFVQIQKMNEHNLQFQQKLDSIDQKCKQNLYPDHLKVRMVEYIYYCHTKKQFQKDPIDFHYFSRPLESKMTFSLNKKLIREVPLFKNLESAEILWILKHLKTAIYLPNDYIIRQGEFGNQFYLLIEGIVKVQTESRNGQKEFLMRKGFFFGEVALFIDTQRTSSVVAQEFCICEYFTRQSLSQLKILFPSAKLSVNFNLYKSHIIDNFGSYLQNNPIFRGFSEIELTEIIKDYTEVQMINGGSLLLKPKESVSAFYFILTGEVARLANTRENVRFLKKYLISKKKIVKNQSGVLNYYDFELLYKGKENNPVITLSSEVMETGQFFGKMWFEQESSQCNDYYFGLQSLQLLVITKDKMAELKFKRPEYYTILKDNYHKSDSFSKTLDNYSRQIEPIKYETLKKLETMKRNIHKHFANLQELTKCQSRQ